MSKLHLYGALRVHLMMPVKLLPYDVAHRNGHWLVSDSVFNPGERQDVLHQPPQPSAFPP